MAKKVFIDPGHGGSDSGAVGVNKVLEKNINLEVAKKVSDFLKKQGLEVKLSRTTDVFLSLEQRTNLANVWKADCFVSIHSNAYNGTASGIETYAYNASVTDLSKAVHEEVLNTGAYTKNRGVKTAGFYVLRYTTMRAALIELAFIDNTEDAKVLTQKQNELAEGIARGICKYLGVRYKPIDDQNKPQEPVSDTNVFYRVVSGSYNNRVFAEERVEELKELGIDSFIAVYTKE